MLKLHVLAAVRTIDVLPFHRARTNRASIAVAGEQVQADRGQRNHYQSDQRLLHEIRIGQLFSAEALLQGVLERADILMMAFRQVQERAQVGIAEAWEVLFDLANDPALTAIEQFQLAAKIGNRANLVDEIAGFVRGRPAEASHMRRQLARLVALVMTHLLEKLFKLGRFGHLGKFVEHPATRPLSFSESVQKSFELRVHRKILPPVMPIVFYQIGTTGQ
jgi:hypothetical protein